MVKVFHLGCGSAKPREQDETILFADENVVRVELVEGHLFLLGDGDKILYIVAPGIWTRAQVL